MKISNCKKCRKIFKFQPSESRGKFCSYVCYWKSKKNKPVKHLKQFNKGRIPWNKGLNSKVDNRIKSGKDNSRWKGTVSKELRERIRFRQELQKVVFERDNYTCQLCGIKGNQTGGRLQVDHIQSWSEYVELRFNINNCRTLCAKCHYKITFGKPMPSSIKTWGHNFSKKREYV